MNSGWLSEEDPRHLAREAPFSLKTREDVNAKRRNIIALLLLFAAVLWTLTSSGTFSKLNILRYQFH